MISGSKRGADTRIHSSTQHHNRACLMAVPLKLRHLCDSYSMRCTAAPDWLPKVVDFNSFGGSPFIHPSSWAPRHTCGSASPAGHSIHPPASTPPSPGDRADSWQCHALDRHPCEKPVRGSHSPPASPTHVRERSPGQTHSPRGLPPQT